MNGWEKEDEERSIQNEGGRREIERERRWKGERRREGVKRRRGE